MRTIYHNNEVEITAEYCCEFETLIKCNSKPLIVIEANKEYVFAKELEEVLDKYKI